MKAIHFIILWTAANTTNCSAPNSRQKSFLPSLVAGSDVPNTNTGEGKAKSCHVTESASADALIECFLRENVGGANDDTKKFHVHGWRWHTLSLVRDAGRLERLALQKIKPTGSDDITAFPTKSDTGGGDSDLDTAAEHVIGFNMKGLFAVEDELFFPWLRSKLVDESSSGVHAADLRSAFGAVLDGIDAERSFVRKLASQVREQARIASSENLAPTKRSEAASNVAQISSTLSMRTRDILTREERLLIPAIAALVSESEQKSFNNRVIRKLGIFDSRLHLVGMYDAVMETADVIEEKLFEEIIPMVPRMMIPRWRRKLYEPQAGVLEGF